MFFTTFVLCGLRLFKINRTLNNPAQELRFQAWLNPCIVDNLCVYVFSAVSPMFNVELSEDLDYDKFNVNKLNAFFAFLFKMQAYLLQFRL